MKRQIKYLLFAVILLAGFFFTSSTVRAEDNPNASESATPIKHVVIIYQENHSFNDLLGKLCVDEGGRCLGSTTGKISNGNIINLITEPDIPPPVGHTHDDQKAAINGGAMNGWDHVKSCGSDKQYRCLTQVHSGAIPTLWNLADTYTISDMTFETDMSSSWGSHLNLVAATLDGFLGNEPNRGGDGALGCLTTSDEQWVDPNTGKIIWVPSCVPDIFGNGPYRASPVKYVPTIMDRLDAAGLSWNIYAPPKGGKAGGYGWSICPTFYECLSTQSQHVIAPNKLARDAANGTLPAVSFLIPVYANSQHDGYSLLKGDNWIAQNVSAIMNGPDWASTAIFVTYDDCGCYYDPVTPPTDTGIRVPMVIVSPYAKPHYVDHTIATDASMLSFIEYNWGLPSLGQQDQGAYNYSDSFNFSQSPLPGIELDEHEVPAASEEYIKNNPPDENDPT